MPLLSIIVPVYNRETFIARCLVSVYGQSFDDYEVIVIDDGSDDRTLDVIEQHPHPALRVIRHEVNKGVGAARMAGLLAASGEWVVLLDSDDELVPNALTIIAERVGALAPSIDAIYFSCRLDNGRITPDPVQDAEWHYTDFMRFMESQYGQPAEKLNCYRLSTVTRLRLPDNNELEDAFNLDFHRDHITRCFPDVLRLYHQDAENQLNKRLLHDPGQEPELAAARATNFESIMHNHGAALSHHAPRIYLQYISRLAVLQFLLGKRSKGFHYGGLALRADPLNVRNWAVLMTGFLGRPALRFARRGLIMTRR